MRNNLVLLHRVHNPFYKREKPIILPFFRQVSINFVHFCRLRSFITVISTKRDFLRDVVDTTQASKGRTLQNR